MTNRNRPEYKIEEYLWQHPEALGVRWMARQLGTRAGVVDLIGYDDESRDWVIVEVKGGRDHLVCDGLLQLLKYERELSCLFEDIYPAGTRYPGIQKVLVNGTYYVNEAIRNAQAIDVTLYEFEFVADGAILTEPRLIGGYSNGRHAAERLAFALENYTPYYPAEQEGANE